MYILKFPSIRSNNGHFNDVILKISIIISFNSKLTQRERGQLAVYYSSPLSLKYRILIRWLYILLGLEWLLISWFIKLSVKGFQPLIIIYRSGNFCIIIGDVHNINLSVIVLSPKMVLGQTQVRTLNLTWPILNNLLGFSMPNPCGELICTFIS